MSYTVLLLCTWSGCILLLPGSRLPRTLKVKGLANCECLHSIFSLVRTYDLGFFIIFLPFFFKRQIDGDRQMRAFLSWIVQIQSQFKGLSLPHCARFSFVASHILLQEINTLSSLSANLNQIITQI